MIEPGITDDERACLRAWFRQAIAEVEQREVAAQFIKNNSVNMTGSSHRSTIIKRRTARARHLGHVKEFVQ